jgi:hypothetical protein
MLEGPRSLEGQALQEGQVGIGELHQLDRASQAIEELAAELRRVRDAWQQFIARPQ